MPQGTDDLRIVSSLDRTSVVVGEPVRLTVRFYQGTKLLADPQYRAPDVPGFWSESTSNPRSFYTTQGGRRWLVTESYTFLYPTVSGVLSIGAAKMICLVPKERDRSDPMTMLGMGRGDGDILEVTSEGLELEVRPPPPGAPAGYDGAVGRFSLAHRGGPAGDPGR